MENYKCAFAGALIGKQYGCQYALEVTRREGPSIACTSEDMHDKCALLFKELKAAALPHLGYEDDLTQMPHSALMKIQMGGLAALQKHILSASELTDVTNIAQLLGDAQQRFSDLHAVPCAQFVQDIADFKLRRRR